MHYRILLLISIIFSSIISLKSFSQSDTVLVHPSLEMVLKHTAWKKIPNFSRTSYEPSPVAYEYRNNKAIKIVINCDAVMVSVDSARKELKMHSQDKKAEGDSVHVSEKKGLTVISFSDLPSIKRNRKCFYEISGIHPEGYIANLNFEAPEIDKKLLDSLVEALIPSIHVVSPNFLDDKAGYPVKDFNKESLVEKRTYKFIDKIKEANPDFVPTEAGYDELNNEARKLVDKDIQWGYSYQKYYKIRKKVTQGKLPYNEWLDCHFLEQDNEDISFLKAYGAGGHGELVEGFNTALAKHFGDTLSFNFIGDALEINSLGKIIFWTYSFPSLPLKDNKSLMIFCFVYDTAYKKWDSYKTLLPKFVAKSEDIAEVKILKHAIGEQEYDNITSDFIIFVNDSGSFFIGNNTLYNTNFIRVSNSFTGIENYKAIIKGVSFNNNKLGYSDIISTGESDGGDASALKSVNADKRLYQSTMMFDDLKNDGANEAYQISVSNGKIVQGRIFATTDKGVKEVPIDEVWKERIKETDFFKKLAKESALSTSGFQK